MRVSVGWANIRRGAVLIALAVVVVGVLCLLSGARRVGRPFPGFLVAYNGIVVSIGRSDWSQQLDHEIPFSQVVGIVGAAAGTASEIQTYCESLPPGTPVTYRFRKGAEFFRATVPSRPFTRADFLALYGNYFLVGLAFALAGLWTLWKVGPTQPATVAFFGLCQSSALVLLSAGDVYGPYRFTALYFAAHCFTPACLLHFAGSFPERLGTRTPRLAALTIVYGASAALALALNLVSNSPSLFLPLVYTVYLLLANSILLYVGRLLISRSSTGDPARRRAIDLALAGVLLAASLPAAIFVIYPVLKGLISPLILVAPLAVFPLVTARALRRETSAAAASTAGSVRLRLSFLFLAAVETAFLVGIGYFWLSSSWQQLLDDIAVYERQWVAVEHFRAGEAAAADDLAQIESYAQSSGVRARVQRAREALAAGDVASVQESMQAVRAAYLRTGERLEWRRLWLSRMDAVLVLMLVLLGVLQAVAFMVAVRRWLIQPIDQLSAATSVIATGDLSYRSRLDSSDEFAMLAESINTMAASLAAIQQRVSAERTARERAAAAARDAERRRLARELHDGVLQDLSAVKLAVEGEVKRAGRDGRQDIVDGLIGLIVNLRRLVDDLRPQDLSHVSLGEAIGNHARRLAERNHIALELDVAGAADVGDWAARDVYRIAQEAISNAVRHGSPSQLAVRVRRRAGEIVLEVSDNGAGFDPESIVRGSGLAGMEERAAALGARLEIHSAPGGGMTVALTIPPSQVPGPTAASPA